MLKQTVILLLSCWLFASVFALQPTPAQQFIILPEGGTQSFSNSWHVGDDIINFYKTKDAEGYVRISHKTSQFEAILNDTITSCQKNLTLLDPSYYHPTVGVFIYYCIANNSLLTIGQNYKVQDAILISTSQKFSEVILGHNEQGLVYILGLPDLLTLPATQPTELILVDLKTKAVENHVIFNKESDSQMLVTGFAFDSGVSYILTKKLTNQTLVEISQIVLSGNDYELSPFASFTYKQQWRDSIYHHRLHIVDGFFFTNNDSYLLIFGKDGDLDQEKSGLAFDQMKKNDIWYSIPRTAAQIGGPTLYAYVEQAKDKQGLAYSLVNKKKMTPKVIDYSSKGMMVALGGLDLIIGLNADTWNIRDAKTNETLYASFRDPKDIMVSESHIGVQGKVENKMYVFDRKNPGQFPKEIEIYPGSHYLDKTTSQVFKLTSTNQYSITDLETLNVHVGNRGASAAFIIRYANLTDRDNPFILTNPIDMDHVLVNPKTYGFLYWKCPNFHSSRGSLVAGDAANEYFYVWNEFAVSNVINIDSYKALAKVGSYPLTINQTQKYENPIYFNLGNKKLLLSFQENVTIIDLALKTFKTYDAPITSSWQSNRDVGVFYDKEKTPYVLITQAQTNFGDPAHTPLLLDLASDNLRPIPGFNPLTKSAKVTGNCGYALVDQFNP